MAIKILIGIGLVILASIGFLTGLFVGIASALDVMDAEHKIENEIDNDRYCAEYSKTEKLYCFDCEIEMPVKVKKGRAFCSNCGLIH
ncbi:hypothetical protein ACFX5D_13280 [Flavobacterium sp. LB3P45]|uniref:Uncharacterized protein n=1 Tax=Flavobacterium fructosi TaxID=3230416 RepID=A0ABW6HQJ4_9FLAO